MTYEDLLNEGRIEEQRFGEEDFVNAVALARAKLADARVTGLSDDTRFTLAYDAARVAAQAVMFAEGYRTLSHPGRHATVFEFLEAVDGGRWVSEAYVFDDARRKRNIAGYDRFGLITQTEADDLIQVAQEFFTGVVTWLRERRLLPGDRE